MASPAVIQPSAISTVKVSGTAQEPVLAVTFPSCSSDAADVELRLVDGKQYVLFYSGCPSRYPGNVNTLSHGAGGIRAGTFALQASGADRVLKLPASWLGTGEIFVTDQAGTVLLRYVRTAPTGGATAANWSRTQTQLQAKDASGKLVDVILPAAPVADQAPGVPWYSTTMGKVGIGVGALGALVLLWKAVRR